MAGEELLPKGAERWALFSAQELRWLRDGIDAGEGEGLLPGMRVRESGQEPVPDEGYEAFQEFVRTLESARGYRS